MTYKKSAWALSILVMMNTHYFICAQHKQKSGEKTSAINEVIKDPNYIELQKKGANYYAHNHYNFALQIYLQLHKLNPADYEINYRTGVCYLNTWNKSLAISYLEMAKKIDVENKYKDINYYLGQAYHFHHLFDKAIENYKTYMLHLNPKSEFDNEMSLEVERLIKQCYNGKELCAHPVNLKVEKLNSKVNSPYPDKYPLISADGNTLYFSTGRPGNTGNKYDFQSEQYFNDIFYSLKNGNEWTIAKKLYGHANTHGNDAPLSISSNGKRIYVYSTVNVDGDIFYTDLKDSAWTSLVDMGENINSEEFESGGCISSDGQTFYFASDREEGFGGFDLYQSSLLPNGKWGSAVNLGPLVNSPYDEADPFLLSDGQTLYFSSKGHNTMGGYDIFVSNFDKSNKRWAMPLNLGFPVNSADDDVSISWSADGKTGYYSEIKEEGYGGEDIYSITLDEKPRLNTASVMSIAEASKTIDKKSVIKNSLVSEKKIISKPKVGDVLKEQVHFVFNETHEITEYSKGKISGVIEIMNKYPDINIEIEGFADLSDDKEFSLLVSQKRAQAVLDHMVKKGINPQRLQLKVCNELQQHSAKTGSTEINIKNRRVEFKVIKSNGSLSIR